MHWEKLSSSEYVLDAPTTDRQLLCVAICSSYMLMDGCFLLVRLPKTCPYFVPWMLHHLATIVYMLRCALPLLLTLLLTLPLLPPSPLLLPLPLLLLR